ncbi:hypothetical protein SAMN05421640_2429 [Ekhidna lutea]|uniref:ABM domain-containing protein n=1 Tax=Ekhidna lutea TaxID=447679 RepID=A0A239K6E0_EKHLU|nr:hypothetical protein [Ekhidna lutea]SNT13252.1 hypothetical protein SAMN05421640_2429 [Ekhidna lutea]
MSMYCLVWKYKLSSNQAKFEEEYGRNGGWFKLFESCEDYLGSDLLKSSDGKTFIVVDKWMSKADYQDFLDENKAEYDQLNEKSKALYDEEEQMGEFDLLQ